MLFLQLVLCEDSSQPARMGSGVIVLIFFVCLGLFLVLLSGFTRRPVVLVAVGVLLPIVIFLILHFWPKDNSPANKHDDLTDYWVLIRWLFFTIMLVVALGSMALMLLKECFRGQFASKISTNRYEMQKRADVDAAWGE